MSIQWNLELGINGQSTGQHYLLALGFISAPSDLTQHGDLHQEAGCTYSNEKHKLCRNQPCKPFNPRPMIKGTHSQQEINPAPRSAVKLNHECMGNSWSRHSENTTLLQSQKLGLLWCGLGQKREITRPEQEKWNSTSVLKEYNFLLAVNFAPMCRLRHQGQRKDNVLFNNAQLNHLFSTSSHRLKVAYGLVSVAKSTPACSGTCIFRDFSSATTTTNIKQIEAGSTILMISSLSNGSSCFLIVLPQHPARMRSHLYNFSILW